MPLTADPLLNLTREDLDDLTQVTITADRAFAPPMPMPMPVRTAPAPATTTGAARGILSAVGRAISPLLLLLVPMNSGPPGTGELPPYVPPPDPQPEPPAPAPVTVEPVIVEPILDLEPVVIMPPPTPPRDTPTADDIPMPPNWGDLANEPFQDPYGNTNWWDGLRRIGDAVRRFADSNPDTGPGQAIDPELPAGGAPNPAGSPQPGPSTPFEFEPLRFPSPSPSSPSPDIRTAPQPGPSADPFADPVSAPLPQPGTQPLPGPNPGTTVAPDPLEFQPFPTGPTSAPTTIPLDFASPTPSWQPVPRDGYRPPSPLDLIPSLFLDPGTDPRTDEQPDPANADPCDCTKTKDKKKKPKREDRSICYKGTYRQLKRGIQYRRGEQVPCESSTAKKKVTTTTNPFAFSL